MQSQDYSKEDFEDYSWSKYERVVNDLYLKLFHHLSQNNITLDAIVPIMRGGSIPATMLAFKLKLLNILPIQYKYITTEGKTAIRGILTPDRINYPMPNNPILLLVENNHCSGATSAIAANDLRACFSGCKIIYAAVRMDYSHQNVNFAESTFYGELTNESRKLTEAEARELGISYRLAVYPWESVDEELAEVSEMPFDYQNVDRIVQQSEPKG